MGNRKRQTTHKKHDKHTAIKNFRINGVVLVTRGWGMSSAWAPVCLATTGGGTTPPPGSDA